MVAAENNSSPAALSTPSGDEAAVSSSPGVQIEIVGAVAPPKKKRNLPGMPDPDAEVIALSPKSLLATNRFVCEICNKGFQRDQNLQLHRRGHNLPWKLRQRTSQEIRKRVYVCPEASCVHHNPARALGDLTGIKKHFSRKHGEKKWKCERCSKKYAVQSDWKAHMKTCGTREYKCDCGTLFSRRDSFITHRAFCDALAEESGRSQPRTRLSFVSSDSNALAAAASAAAVASSPPPPPLTPLATVLSPALSIQSSEQPDNPIGPPPLTPAVTSITSATSNVTDPINGGGIGGRTSIFAGVFASSPAVISNADPNPPQPITSGSHPDWVDNPPSTATAITIVEPTSLTLSTSLFLSCRSSGSSIFQDHPTHYLPSPQLQP
ncbi:protein indeterminate-domain 2-like, partial [Momordica charantia]|uniref:Protein indeterminate-domain 2-like n=1 Tax=Momordica charantia TaxID=3673 RepID=A0A6J1CSF4_MOMCH